MEVRAAAYVARMDAARSGSGGHYQTFYVARVLVHSFELSDGAALGVMREFSARCDPAWSESELVHKVQSARGSVPTAAMLNLRDKLRADEHDGDRRESRPAESPVGAPTKEERLDYDPLTLGLLAEPWNAAVGSVWLANRSAVDPAGLDAAGFLRVLYPESERVLVFTDQRSQGQAVWPVDTLPGGAPEGVWFLPQPVDGEYHPNPRAMDARTGKPKASRRSMESVTAWRYMLLESDEADMRDWLGLLVQMPLKIAAIYSSGGRSIHVLIRIDATTKKGWDAAKERLKPCLNLLCLAGVDWKALTAVRLSRLPQCVRGRSRQKLFYVHPDPPLRPLIEMTVTRDVEEQLCAQVASLLSGAVAVVPGVFDGLRYYSAGSERVKMAMGKLRDYYGD
jgi:hypothetical protein